MLLMDMTEAASTNINLETFQLVNGNLVYKCSQCNLSFSQNSQFFRHLSEEHEKQNYETAKYICNDCDKVFTKKYLLDVHYQTNHSSKSSSKCETCLVTFKSRHCLRSHIKSKQCKRENMCSKCKKYCPNAEKLASHLIDKHSFKRTGYKCNECRRCFKNIASLLCHKLRLHKSK